MNLNIITNAVKSFFLGILHNLIPILFLVGLGVIVTAIYLVNVVAGMIATGLALILIALILAREQSEPTE